MASESDLTAAQEECARLLTALEQRRRQVEAVRRISQALHSKTRLDDLLHETLAVSLETVGADAGSLIIYDPEKDQLVFRYVVGDAAESLNGFALAPTKGIAGEVFQSGIPRITEDATTDASHCREVDRRSGFITRNIVTVPLKTAGDKQLGVMQILNKKKGIFTKPDLEVLTILGQQAAGAIENARLHEEAKLAEVVKLMGDISHDIKNMITPVVTCAQTLELLFAQMYSDLDQIGAHAQDVAAAVQGMQEAVAPLRSFYPEAVEMLTDGALAAQERVREIADCVKGITAKPHFVPTDINEVADKVCKPLSLMAERAGVYLRREHGDVPRILADQKQLYNALYNLINNAIPETPEGGSVTIRTQAGPEGVFPEGDYLLIEVADTGRGMPEEVRKHLFTKDAVSTKPGGTGLGTKIVKNVVDAHRGVITVESEQGKGSRFTIKLPLHPSGER